ncbi:MAG: hypothetical protein HWQ35_04705 [Nostoc sp. NMS1]|uniref:hypothetical protein n=1 Tax=unclassified Nostoc TaxID=2593658 RepID=UPI0025E454EB|nr:MULTISPECIES: hypothetical protein [unclassified Nostoc]MBN3905895.1 hypothetical protein [Nostoc sp. NMS1]MBN3989291.1 hypothetical protein [Nostoc sp. NMS2]
MPTQIFKYLSIRIPATKAIAFVAYFLLQYQHSQVKSMASILTKLCRQLSDRLTKLADKVSKGGGDTN